MGNNKEERGKIQLRCQQKPMLIPTRSLEVEASSPTTLGWQPELPMEKSCP